MFETKYYQLMQRVGNKKEVGNVAIALNEKDAAATTWTQAIEPKDFGVIDFVAERGCKVKLIPEEGAATHQDGDSGEVFLRTYTERGSKQDMETMAGKCFVR